MAEATAVGSTPAVRADLSASRRRYLHVGAPKTGTTYLQNVLWKNREALAEAGVGYPLERRLEHFDAALDLRGMAWGGRRDPAWEGAWERIAERAHTWAGPSVVISDELLGGASEDQVRRAVASLQPGEVHVVFTARDLARQLPSDWQEHLKHRHRVTFATFVDDLIERGLDAPAPFGEMFWGLHDAAEVLRRWKSAVPPERIHLVTVPQPGAPPGLLWQRFATVLGLDPNCYDTDVAHSNPSLGVVEAELLRRLNTSLQGRFPQPHYDPLVRVRLAETVLTNTNREGVSGRRIELTPERRSWVVARSRRTNEELSAARYDIVGDLEELVPLPPRADVAAVQPEELSEAELYAPAMAALTGLLQHAAQLRDRAVDAERRLSGWQQTPVRQWLIELSERTPALMALRRGYWAVVKARRALS